MAAKRKKALAPPPAAVTSMSQEAIEAALMRAIARNGDNTLLLDLTERIAHMAGGMEVLLTDRAAAAQDRAAISEKMDAMTVRMGVVEQVVARIPVIEPEVWKLVKSRTERAGVRKLIEWLLSWRGAMWAAIVAGLGLLGIHVSTLPKP